MSDNTQQLYPGLKFKSKNFPYLAEIKEINENNNTCSVELTPQSNHLNASSWIENDWNLQHTKWGFKNREYYAIEDNTVLSDQEKAAQWWEGLTQPERDKLVLLYYDNLNVLLTPLDLTIMWRRETSSPTTTVKEGEEGFTKGEWEIRGNKIFVKGTYNSICQVHVKKNYEEVTFEPIQDVEAEANAHLIAAAPDLVYALKECIWAMRQTGFTDQAPSMVISYKAFLKAKLKFP